MLMLFYIIILLLLLTVFLSTSLYTTAPAHKLVIVSFPPASVCLNVRFFPAACESIKEARLDENVLRSRRGLIFVGLYFRVVVLSRVVHSRRVLVPPPAHNSQLTTPVIVLPHKITAALNVSDGMYLIQANLLRGYLGWYGYTYL